MQIFKWFFLPSTKRRPRAKKCASTRVGCNFLEKQIKSIRFMSTFFVLFIFFLETIFDLVHPNKNNCFGFVLPSKFAPKKYSRLLTFNWNIANLWFLFNWMKTEVKNALWKNFRSWFDLSLGWKEGNCSGNVQKSSKISILWNCQEYNYSARFLLLSNKIWQQIDILSVRKKIES